MDGHPEIRVDLDAITANAAALCRHAGPARLMAVVKSDGYGHGMIATALAAIAGGASWLGVVQLADAVALRDVVRREAGLDVPVLCLTGVPGAPHQAAVAAGVDLTAGTPALLAEITAAARRAGAPARVHLEADTGMGRGGATAADWPALVAAARAAEVAGDLRVIGVWSHFACADMPGHESIAIQLAAFSRAVALAQDAGLRPEVRHLANTPATLTRPESWLDLVRPGGAIVGLSTLPGGAPDWLRPAMTVAARLVQTKRVPAGTGVSYGHRHVTAGAATLGVVPLGYNEGVPRLASGRAQMAVRGRRFTIAGTVNMNQTILDFGDSAFDGGPVRPGDEVILFGPGDAGEPTAQEWADALGTLSYEIVTRFTGQVPRTYSGVTLREHPWLAADGRADGHVAAAH